MAKPVKAQHVKGGPPSPKFHRIVQAREVEGERKVYTVEGRTFMEAAAKLPRFGKLLRQDNSTFEVGGGA